ncbi:MAG: TRAP transporter large permease [Syntrophaceae bacterium]
MTLAIIFVALLLLGVPVAFTLGLTALAYIALETPLPPLVAFQRMFTSVDSFPFVAIPFFMLAGNLMGAGGLAQRIINLARTMVGHLRGGLANVTVVSNMIMGGISGSSVADCSALGSILIPGMKEEGYSSKFAGAVNATASTMGIIIPPSIPMILTGAATSLSIRDLFFGGLVPGLLIGLGMLVITTYRAKKRNYPKYPRATRGEFLKALFRGLPAFIMVAIILIGIMTGIFTPTEASVAAVLYALLVGIIDRELTWKGFYEAMFNAAVSSAVVMVVISTAGLLTWLLAYSMIPQTLTTSLAGVIDSPTTLFVVLGVVFLLVGCVLDVSPAVLLFGPVLLPLVTAVGGDPVFFGVMMVFALAIGLVTPPVGTTMMLSAYIAGVTILDVAKESIPYIIYLIVLLYCLIFIPGLILWVPNYLFH